MPIQWTTDSKGNRTATWVDDEPAAPKAQGKPAQSGGSVPGSGVLDVITKDAPALVESSAKGITQGVQTLQRTGDPIKALSAAGRAYMDVVEKAENPVPRVVLSGARDLVQNVLGNTPADIGSLLTGKPRMQNAADANLLGVLPPLPRVKLQGPGEELASNIVQFGLGWFPAAKAVSLTGQVLTKIPAVTTGVQAARTATAFAKGNKVAGAAIKAGEIATKGALTGSVVDFAGMDVEGGRLTDVVVQLNPTIRKFTEQTIGTPLEIPYLEYLQSKPGDTAANARWKNAIEGNFFVGPAFESVMWATGRFARASSQYIKAIGEPKAAAEAVVDVTAQAVPTPKAPKASKAEVAEAEAELQEAAQTLQDALAKTAQPEAVEPTLRTEPTVLPDAEGRVEPTMAADAPAAAAAEPSVPSAGTSAPVGPTAAEIDELDQALAMGRADLSPEQRVALRDQVLAEKYATGSPAEPPATAMEAPAPASVVDEGGEPPLPPAEPPRFTDPDSTEWAVRFAEQVAANLDNIKAGRVAIDDLLANNFQKFQSPSGNTQYVAKQPELVAGYDAMSQVLPERDELSGIPTFNKQELTQLNQDWFYRHGADGDAILKGLSPLIKGFEEYQLGALHRAMVLADKKNLEAAMEGAMWINSGAFSGVNVSERLARLVESAAAAKRVNLAVMKVTRPWGQLGLEMQMDRNLVVPKEGNLDAPLVDIAAELRKNLQEGDSETLEETLLGKFHPDLADAARGGEVTPEAQSAADALAETLQDIHAEKKAAPRFWEGLDEMPSNSATEAFLAMRTNNLISSGITMSTNLLNGLINMPVLTAQQVFGRGLKGDWRGVLNDIGQFQRFFLQLESGFRMFGHSFKAGRSLTNMDSSSVDFLGKAAKQDAVGEAALEPKRSSSMVNSFPLISEEMANTRMGQMADWMWRVLGTPFSRMAVSTDTFNSTVAGYAYEHTRHMGRGMELAIERGLKENSSEAWKWANQYADARVKESVKNVVLDGRTLGEAALTSPHAKTFMDAVNFTDKLSAELQPRTMAEGVRLGELEGLKGDELQAFAENYIQEGTNMQKLAKLMLDGPVPLGRIGSIPGAGMTALAKAKYVGPVFRFVQPFITVPNNIMKTMARNTFAAPLVDTWWRDMASEDPGTKARALGQATSGSLFAGFVMLQVSLGNVRINGGGPVDPRAREEWQNVQKRVPYSLQLPDGQGGWSAPVSMRAFEPFSTLFGAIGDYSDMAGSLSDVEREKLGGSLVLTLMQLQASNLLSKTYFQGANELYEAIFGVGQNDTGTRALERLQRYIARNVVATMVPGISFLRAGRRVVDPLARTTDVVDPDQVGGIVQSIFYQALDEVRISVPGQSEEYPVRLHPITGRPIVLSGIWGTEFIPEDQPWMAALAQLAPWSPLQVGEKNIDPVDMEMGRLSELGSRFSLPQASDFGAGTRLTRTELNQYIDTFSSVRVMGRTIHDRLLEAIQSEAYQSWPYETKEAGVPGLRSGYLQEIVSEYKEVAKQQFLNTSAVGAQIQRQTAEVERRKGVQDFTRRYGGSTAPLQPEGLR